MSIEDIPLGNIPQWKNGFKINPDLGAVPGFNPLIDFLNNISSVVGSSTSNVLQLNANKKQAIEKAQSYIDKYSQGKNAVRDNLVSLVNDYASDFSSLGAKFIIPEPFYGGLSNARENSVKNLSATFQNVPFFLPDTWVSSFTLIANIGNDLVNGIKILIMLSTLLNGKTTATLDSISDIIHNPLLSPIADLIQNNEPLFSNGLFNDTETSFDDPIKGVIDTTGSLLFFSQETKGIISDLWDNSVFKDIETDIDLTDPTGNTTALGTILSTIKDNANKPLDLSNSGIENPFNTLVSRINQTNTDFTKTPYNTWFNLLTLGDLLPGIKDVASFVTKVAGEVSDISDFASNGITNGLNFVNQITDYGTGVISELSNKSTGIIDGLKQDLNLAAFDLFLVPPVQGGLEQLRYIHSEWMKSDIPNAPQYDPDTLSIMVTVVFGMPTDERIGLTNLAKIFNINLV